METSINARIKEIRKYYCNDSNILFAKMLLESGATVNNWVRDGYSVGRGVASKIVEKFPNVSLDWLLNGKGEMLKNHQPTNNTGITDSNVVGGGVNDAAVISGLMKTLEKKDEQIGKILGSLEKKDEQIDRLLGIIEKLRSQ